MVTTPIASGVRYSGIWTLAGQANAKALGTWMAIQFLYSWGQNNNGQLGLGNTTNRSSPNQVGSLSTWLSVSAGGYAAAAIKTDGSLWTWGKNNNGQLGITNALTTVIPSPVQVGTLTAWSKIDVGRTNFMLSIKADGTLWAWGLNASGQLGIGFTASQSSPVQVGTLTDWSTVSAGNDSGLATKTNGTLWSWGENDNGQLGHNNTTDRSSPVQVGNDSSWSNVSAGIGRHFIAVKANGTLWAWGIGSSGQLGLGDAVSRSSPTQVGALTTWLKVSAGSYTNAAIKTDGTLWTWGRNNFGQLGLDNTTNTSSPIQVGALTTWLTVVAGFYHCVAIKTDGTLWTWGKNSDGQLGQNLAQATYRSSPIQVGALTTWLSISGRFHLAVALAST